jgi:hypothetical protein
LGVYAADVDSANLPTGSIVVFTIRYDDGAWDGTNYEVEISEGPVRVTGP